MSIRRILPLSAGYVGEAEKSRIKAMLEAPLQTVKEIKRDSFGVPYYDSFPGFVLPIGFAGGLEDPDTGLVRFGWRDYDPTIGRFTSLDPAKDRRGNGDLYDYCMDDPVSRVDPLGLWSKENFDESKVSRDGQGQFASTPGGGELVKFTNKPDDRGQTPGYAS